MSEPLYADWAIVGAQHGRGVRVIASKKLKPGSSLSIVQAESDGVLRGRPVRLYEHEAWKITVMAEDVVIVDAPDYPTAMRLLFSGWSVPEQPEPVRAIFAPRNDGQYPAASMEQMAAIEVVDLATEIVDAAADGRLTPEERESYLRMLGEEP